MKDGDEIVVQLGEEEPQEEDAVTIIVRRKDDQKKFSLKKTDPFQKLFDGYCALTGVKPSSIRFIFDGDELDLSSSPEDEGMEHDDIVDVKG